MKDIYLSTQTTLIITLVVGAFFIALGYINLKKISDNKSLIIGDRKESIFSLIHFTHIDLKKNPPQRSWGRSLIFNYNPYLVNACQTDLLSANHFLAASS